MRKNTGGHMIDLLFTLALFCMFAVSSLLVLVIGTSVYERTAAGMEENFGVRTSLSYVSEKIRQNDTAGAVRLDTLGDTLALVLEQDVDGELFQTWIYHHAGSLCELFVRKGGPVGADAGTPIMQVQEFRMERLGDRLYRLTSVDEAGKSAELVVSTRCESGIGKM